VCLWLGEGEGECVYACTHRWCGVWSVEELGDVLPRDVPRPASGSPFCMGRRHFRFSLRVVALGPAPSLTASSTARYVKHYDCVILDAAGMQNLAFRVTDSACNELRSECATIARVLGVTVTPASTSAGGRGGAGKGAAGSCPTSSPSAFLPHTLRPWWVVALGVGRCFNAMLMVLSLQLRLL
jgi:hypothetical protein